MPSVSGNAETQVQATLHLLIKPLLNVCYPELYLSDYEVKDVLVQPCEVLHCEVLDDGSGGVLHMRFLLT